ncbi:MAG: hypothetical protein FWD57_06950 [Polyangiaceae bacterium]|nr:hypothetical protein [Polyangiaceae bacterium]
MRIAIIREMAMLHVSTCLLACVSICLVGVVSGCSVDLFHSTSWKNVCDIDAWTIGCDGGESGDEAVDERSADDASEEEDTADGDADASELGYGVVVDGEAGDGEDETGG